MSTVVTTEPLTSPVGPSSSIAHLPMPGDLRTVFRGVDWHTYHSEHLQADGSYAPAEASRFLRIRADDVLRWLNDAATERESAWSRRLHQWAMELGRQA